MAKIQQFGFKGTKRVSIQEPLFLYIEWGNITPDNNEELKRIIDEIDLDLYPNDVNKSIGKNFPFLTFLQAENLFSEIKDNFQHFTFNGIALVSQVSGSKLLGGKVSFGNGPRITPFVIDERYENIVISLISETRRDKRFEQYSFDDLAKYFCTVEPNLMDVYKDSLGISVADLPVYPPSNSIEGELDRDGVSSIERPTPQTVTSKSTSNSYSEPYSSNNEGRNKNTLILGALALVMSVFAIGFCSVTYKTVKDQDQKINFLYEELTMVKKVQENEHAVDMVSRYFITYYFTGNKEAIKPYLSNGDAKFTQPIKAQVTSTILEKISLNDDGETYNVSYVIGLRTENSTVSSERISFNIKSDEQSLMKWVVISEPLREPFSSTNGKEN